MPKIIYKHKVGQIKCLVNRLTNEEIGEILGMSKKQVVSAIVHYGIKRNLFVFLKRKKRKCVHCKKIKGLRSFRPITLLDGKKSYRGECRVCAKKWSRENNRDEEYRKRTKEIYRKDDVRRMFIAAKGRAKSKNLPFNLTIDYLRNMWDGKCSVTGIEFEKIVQNKQSPYRPSLDRIEDKNGYTIGNVRIILWGLNKAISNFGEDTYIHIASHALPNLIHSKKIA